MNTTLNNFFDNNYKEIVHIARRITKTSDRHVYQELAHYAMEAFVKHPRAEELIEKKQAKLFFSGIMHRYYYSSTSPWSKQETGYGKKVPLKVNQGYVQGGAGGDLVSYEDISNLWVDGKEHHYNAFSTAKRDFEEYEAQLEHAIDGTLPEDFTNVITWSANLEAVKGIMEDMEADTIEQWFRVKLFQMWLEQPNYSELSRITQIPRTSISQAVNECKEYIKTRIEQWK